MSKVFIRADGNFHIGLGHLYRCFALAQMIKNDFDVVLISKEIPVPVIQEFAQEGLETKIISNEEEFILQLPKECIVVLDGYHFPASLHRRIKDKGAKLVCIDDLHDKEFYGDLIINHTAGITSQDYKAEPYTQFALGLDYALLRPSFLAQAKKERLISRITRLMICFGGSDHKNLTQKTLKTALFFSELHKIIVVTGASFKVTEVFLSLISSDNRIEHRHSLSEKKMLATMLESDLAIVPASSILIEVLAAGCKVISGMYTDNQKYIHKYFKDSNIFIDAGRFSVKDLKNALSLVLKDDSRQNRYIDGLSSKRILKLFNQLVKEYSVDLRRAGKEDLDLTFKWASDPVLRQFSFTRHQITIEEHHDWFNKKTTDPDCHYLIVEYNHAAVGSIRFEVSENNALINYLLDKQYHGSGLGQIILKKGIEWLSADNKLYPSGKIKVIIGFVMINNTPSVRAFERLGFAKKIHNGNYQFEKLVS